MNRRQFLAGICTSAIIASSGCVEDNFLGVLGSNRYIKEHNWINLNDLEIVFQEDHDTDGFAILHEHHDHFDRSIVAGASPEFSGPIHIPLIDMIESGDTVYPTANFRIDLYEGDFSEWNAPFSFNVYGDRLGSYNFEVPPEIRPPANFQDE